MNLPVDIKKVFLSFVQEWFQTQHSTLPWDPDIRRTKIFIGDKFVADSVTVERTPSIILTRGDMSWAQSSIDQMQNVDYPFSPTGEPANKKRTDLIKASITFQCVSQNGIEAETLANILFLNIVGYKDQFRSNGIHQIIGTSMGEEVLLRGDVVPRLIAVPVHILFTVQASLATTLDLYTIEVLIDGDFTPYAEDTVLNAEGSVYNNWLAYEVSGLSLIFSLAPPAGSQLAVTYTGKYTLQQYVNVTPAGIADGNNKIFTLGEDVYTPYYIFSGIAASGIIDDDVV